MLFKKFSAGTVSYGSNSLTQHDVYAIMKQRNPEIEEIGVSNVSFEDPKFYEAFARPDSQEYKDIIKVLECLVLCHTIIAYKHKGMVTYNSTSPDELALVNAAKFFGFKFIERDENSSIVIERNGEMLKYKLLELIEFTSERQRMSVLV